MKIKAAIKANTFFTTNPKKFAIKRNKKLKSKGGQKKSTKSILNFARTILKLCQVHKTRSLKKYIIRWLNTSKLGILISADLMTKSSILKSSNSSNKYKEVIKSNYLSITIRMWKNKNINKLSKTCKTRRNK